MPDSFDAGTTVKYTKSFADYTAAGGWTMKIHVAGLHLDATANGSAWDFELTAAQTAGIAPGTYTWDEIATKSGVIERADQGTVVIELNPTTATAAQSRDPKEAELVAYTTCRDALISGKVASYQIGGRAVTYHDLPWVESQVARLRREIKANKFPGRFGPTIQTHFTRPA